MAHAGTRPNRPGSASALKHSGLAVLRFLILTRLALIILLLLLLITLVLLVLLILLALLRVGLLRGLSLLRILGRGHCGFSGIQHQVMPVNPLWARRRYPRVPGSTVRLHTGRICVNDSDHRQARATATVNA